jgi:hypothetical protein
MTLPQGGAAVTAAGRFGYEMTAARPDRPAMFWKVAQVPAMKRQLARESCGLQVAGALGIPTATLLVPYEETADDRARIGLARFDPQAGRVLSGREPLAQADPAYGVQAARALVAASGRALSPEMDTALLQRHDWRNQSPTTFWRGWASMKEILLASQHHEMRDRLISRAYLVALLERIEETLKTRLKREGVPGQEVFVHNDCSPSNLFFEGPATAPETRVLLFDFEYAGATRHPVLAQLTDWGNYYGRCWPNPAMQQAYLLALARSGVGRATGESERGEEQEALVEAVAVFGTLSLARFAMEPGHPEHVMAVSLLEQLSENLAQLEAGRISAGRNGRAAAMAQIEYQAPEKRGNERLTRHSMSARVSCGTSAIDCRRKPAPPG